MASHSNDAEGAADIEKTAMGEDKLENTHDEHRPLMADHSPADPETDITSESSALPPSSRTNPIPPYLDNTYIGSLGYVASIEGLRGVSLITPMWDHVALTWPFRDAVGTIGVASFFVLSGFLITGVLIDAHDRAQKRHADAKGLYGKCLRTYGFLPRFYADRAIRLWPALWFCLFVIGLWWYSVGHPVRLVLEYAARAIFSVTNWQWPSTQPPTPFWNTWSLSVEEQFYVLWSLSIPFLVARSQRAQAFIIGGLASISFYFRHVAMTHPQYALGFAWHWSLPAMTYKLLLGASLRFFPVPRFLAHPASAYVGLIVMAFIVYGANGTMYHAHRWTDTFAAFCTVPILTGSLHGNRLLETSLLRYLGRISYAAYIWQFPIIEMSGGFHHSWYQGLSATGLAFAFAQFSTHYIEEPIRHAYRRYTKPSHG